MSQDLSPILPGHFRVIFPGRRCAGSPADLYPSVYRAVVDLADLDLDDGDAQGSPQTLTVRSTACALFSDPNADPTNAAALDALAQQLAMDVLSWRTLSFDEAWAGMAVPDPTGLHDVIEWNYGADWVTTRARSGPLNGEPEEFSHLDPATAGCKDVGTVVVAKTPAIEFYGPSAGPGGGGATGISGRRKLTLEEGRLVDTFVQFDAAGECTKQCTTPGSINVYLEGCIDGSDGKGDPTCSLLATAIVQVVGAGGRVIEQTSTFKNGGFSLPNPGPGTYTVKVSGVPGYQAVDKSILITDICQVVVIYYHSPAFHVGGCFANPLPNATVSLNTPLGNMNQTTDASGNTCFKILVPNGTAPLTYTVTPPSAASARFQSVTGSWGSLSFLHQCFATSGPLLPTADYLCFCLSCAWPIKKTLNATILVGDSAVSMTLNYNPGLIDGRTLGLIEYLYIGQGSFDFGGCPGIIPCPAVAGVPITFILAPNIWGTGGASSCGASGWLFYHISPGPTPPFGCPGGEGTPPIGETNDWVTQFAGNWCPDKGAVLVMGNGNVLACVGGYSVTITE